MLCLPCCNSLVRSIGEELIQAGHQITVIFFFFSPHLAGECFENSVNVGGQSGRLQIQVCMLLKETSMAPCFLWLVQAVVMQKYPCPTF